VKQYRPILCPISLIHFFTTREDGHGLGLSIVYSIIKRHDGHITVESSNEGLFYTLFPKAESIYNKDQNQPDTGYLTSQCLFDNG
jgi:nitrogen-specific signal transduction histidine kinase